MEQLRRWLRGEARAIDERRLEESAADDPFLGDALEGYRRFSEGEHAGAAARLGQRLRERTQRRGGAFIRWLPRAAAAAVALVLIGTALWYLTAPGAGTDAAVMMNEPIPKERTAPPPPDAQAGDEEAAPAAEGQPVFPPPPPPSPSSEAVPEPASAAELAETGGEAPETARPAHTPSAAPPPAPAVSGRVTDAQGAPVKGAEVILPGAAETETDSAGAFALTAPTESEDLLINRPGYQPALVPAAPQDSLFIVLEETKKAAPAMSRTQRLPKGLPKTAGRASPPLAQPLGGMPAFESYLRDNQRFEGPDSSAIVLLQFTVRPDSTLHDFQILHSSDSTLNDEAVRLLREGPKWIPNAAPPVIVKQPVVFEKRK